MGKEGHQESRFGKVIPLNKYGGVPCVNLVYMRMFFCVRFFGETLLVDLFMYFSYQFLHLGFSFIFPCFSNDLSTHADV